MKLVEQRLFIDAPPARVYALLTDAALLVEWMAPFACADPRPEGALSWTHVNGDSVVGAFVELVPDRRVVFTFGWDRADVGRTAAVGPTTWHAWRGSPKVETPGPTRSRTSVSRHPTSLG